MCRSCSAPPTSLLFFPGPAFPIYRPFAVYPLIAAITIFILSEFMAQIPKDLREATLADGVSDYAVF